MSLSALRNGCNSIISQKKSLTAWDLACQEFTVFSDALFCNYQKKLAFDPSPVLVCEKGRQVGYSYLTAFRAVYKAANNERDTVYMSYNRESAKDFMREVHRWSKIFNLTFSLYEDICIDQNAINIFECNFLNLRKIIAVSGNCTNLRGKPGSDVILDEVTYHESSMDDILAASMATLIHGGSVRIGSTHAGIDSDFNKLIERVKSGELPYTHMKVTFKDAVKDGLYKRICARKKEAWTQESEDSWVENIYNLYGLRASEELDAIPSDYSVSGKIFNQFQFFEMGNFNDWEVMHFRYHDLAASEDKDDLNQSACYSASVRMTYIIASNLIVITDWTAEKVSPLEGDAMIEKLALEDGFKANQIIEQEPGSTGLKYVAIMQERLARVGIVNVSGYRPEMTKIKRAIPAGNAIQSGELKIDSNLKEKEQFCNLLRQFSNKPKPLVTDVADCVSGCYDFILSGYNWMMT